MLLVQQETLEELDNLVIRKRTGKKKPKATSHAPVVNTERIGLVLSTFMSFSCLLVCLLLF